MDEQLDRCPTDLTAEDIAAIRRVLIKTRELISTPARWTRFVFARNSRGQEVSALSPHAARFCLAGALLAAIHRLHKDRIEKDARAADAEGFMPLNVQAAKTLAFVGLVLAALTCDPQGMRLEARRFGCRDPENGGEDGFTYDSYSVLPASFNDAAGFKHSDILQLLDQTRAFLDAWEKQMKRANLVKPKGKRTRTTVTAPPSSNPSSKASPSSGRRPAKPRGKESSDES